MNEVKDVSPELYQAVSGEISKLIKENKRFAELSRLVANKTATIDNANEYAELLSEVIKAAFGTQISADVLPNGTMYWNICNSVVKPILEENSLAVGTYAANVIQRINNDAGIMVKSMIPEIDEEQIVGIMNKLSSGPYSETKWIIDRSVETLMRQSVMDAEAKSANTLSDAGVKATLTRVLGGGEKGCKWCRSLAGVYISPFPKDIFKVHDNCKCSLYYSCGVDSYYMRKSGHGFTSN